MNITDQQRKPIGYMNGRIVSADELMLPVYDLGFVHGAAVVETLRTFRHQLFRPLEHWERLKQSMQMLGISDKEILEEINLRAHEIVLHNSKLIQPEEELGLIAFVTAGPNSGYLGKLSEVEKKPTVCIHTFRLPFELWSQEWERGQDLCVSQVMAMPEEVIPPTVKYRSRLHWFLADREVAARHPGSRAILSDERGFLTETSSGNLFIVRGRTLISPPRCETLPGISQQMVIDLGKKLGYHFEEQPLGVIDLIKADEVFVTSTSWCIMPVRSINGEPLKRENIWRQLLNQWSAEVDVDIAQQIIEHG